MNFLKPFFVENYQLANEKVRIIMSTTLKQTHRIRCVESQRIIG